MKEAIGNIWDFYEQGRWIVIPTNLSHKANGDAVMGAGLARQASDRFPALPHRLGLLGDGVHGFPSMRLYALPTKNDWREPAKMDLIEEGAWALSQSLFDLDAGRNVYLPRLGCGERTGQLQWEDVKPVLKRHLDDRFTVVTLEDGDHDN